MVAFVFVAMLLCATAIVLMTPTYTARGLVLVGSPSTKIVDLEAVLSGVSAEADAVDSQIEVLQSWALADAVVQRLSLDSDPEFNPDLRPHTIWDDIASALGYMRRLVFRAQPRPELDPTSPQAAAAAAREDTVLNFLSKLSVSSRERSRLLDVAFTSENPDHAAKIVDALLDLYIAQQVDEKYSATIEATESLSRNVTSWQKRTSDSERRIEEFRAQADLLEGEHGVLVLRQLSETNDQLTAASVARNLAEVRLRQIEEYGLDALDGTEQSTSSVLAGLREREAQLMATEAEMRTKFGAGHARVASIQEELQKLRDAMADESERIIRGLKVDLTRQKAVEQALGENLERLKKQVAAANMARVELEALHREADANGRILEVFTSRLAETRGQADRSILQPDANIITRAGVPFLPSYPKPKLYFAVAFVLAIGAGLLFIVLAETLRRGFCSGDEVEYATGVPVLGLLPRVAGTRRMATLPQVPGLRRSVVAENSVRWLGHTLFLNGHQSHVIMLTSAKAEEGKTTAAVALARFLARDNCATLLIEADWCRPQLHKTLGAPASPGLYDLLSGTASLDTALHKDDVSGVCMLTAGMADRSVPDAMPWSAMEALLASLRQRFDLVIVDGPPVLQAPEASLLSKLADATIFVVRWAKTDRRMVTAGLDQLAQSGGRIAGILLTMVNRKKYARYADDDSRRFLFEGERRSAH